MCPSCVADRTTRCDWCKERHCQVCFSCLSKCVRENLAQHGIDNEEGGDHDGAAPSESKTSGSVAPWFTGLGSRRRRCGSRRAGNITWSMLSRRCAEASPQRWRTSVSAAMMIAVKGASLLVVIALVVVACSAVDGATPCERAEDCASSAEARGVGRCAPELACVAGTCRAECLGLCSIDPENRFPTPQCERGGICNQPVVRKAGAPLDNDRCTRRTIHCTHADDCPRQKPTPDGEWTCDAEGICRFPGFAFEYD